MSQANILAHSVSELYKVTLTTATNVPRIITNTAVKKQQATKMFQTVNHAIVLWDPKIKPKGIYGGHLNIRSVVSKTEQLEQLLTNSILKDIAKKFQLTQMVNRPTRLTKSSQTLLDLIFTNKPDRLTNIKHTT